MQQRLIIGGLVIVLFLIGAVYVFFPSPQASAPSKHKQPEQEQDTQSEPAAHDTTNEAPEYERTDTPEVSAPASAVDEVTLTTETAVEVTPESTPTPNPAPTPAPAPSPTVKSFTVEAYNYGFSLSEIEVNEGDTVRITLRSSDSTHDWVIDEFDVATRFTPPGETDVIEFVATQAGEFIFYCSIGNHRAEGMRGTLIVNPR